ncbi:hypothetical protein [Ornithinibacillus xuwenensis]|uniref:Prophage pi2 protein 38 n=1 Tax=Ornithinibacillus xuwenensis TaxID=3144668 RepID=A0ABU9XBP6_9BACI
MTLIELNQLLKATGLPVAYSHFRNTESLSPPSPPFITYLELDSNNFYADNKTYKQVRNVNIELYTNKKDLEAESKIENLLDSNDIPYETTPTEWIESEKLFQKIYEIGVI